MSTGTREPAIARAMRPVNSVVEKYIPSALNFAILLSVAVGLMALLLTDAGPADVLRGWGEGLAGLLAFMTQMALILLLGHALANTRPVRRLLGALAQVPRTPLQAYVFVFLVAAVASLITWGLGLVVGALLARDVAAAGDRRGLELSFPMLVASGFSGFVVWHMGYSGSGPLTAATPGSFIEEQLGRTVPITETTFSAWNLTAVVATVVLVALALWLIAPRAVDPAHRMTAAALAASEQTVTEEEVVTPADRLDASRVPTLVVGLALAGYLVLHFAEGGTVTLDVVNWMFLGLIFLLARNAFEVMALIKNAAANVGDILLQFPLYAGIMGMMAATGLIQVLSDSVVAVATPQTLGLLAFLSAGLVNFFVPSGGGQVAVQAPILLDAGARLDVDPAVVIMAISYGDQWTNMIQPFWALPLLAIAGLKIRDILGYTTVVLVVSGLVFGATLLLVGAG
ncbi:MULTISPECIES: short-chain fatty acid transporter [Kocuria]|jgi:short-chain fatty acids transporter|uniref:Serine--pyruvate aminotransferase n=1 Tax=Kocuria rosea subsp. polaris TaxID=136273 RepID=A0A0A6VR70_KOCRO|nr:MULTISPECIES: TIGR00366 family protein [Kocuria]KHD97101.1 serine--pyruvate aminotransferase [Kocuria polaris]PAU92334.1 serine--pyruvate aminotransferase [Kocuria sp. WN036]PWF83182.1 short-chain fatty acid transporter [Kocuria rosea]WJZ67215.1 TIGR00366 family protein [Kocuria rosea]VEH44226.1 Short-chain fatty acids transporter [Kocuria rosea]